MGLRDIINVTIDRQTNAVSRAGFGTVLIVGSDWPAAATDRIRFYSSLTALENDFPVTTAAYRCAAAAFAQTPGPARVAVGRHQASAEALNLALTAIDRESSDWYGLVITSRIAADVELASAWVESSKRKIFATASNDSNILLMTETGTTASIAKSLKTSGRSRSIVLYHDLAAGAAAGAVQDPRPEVAWLARMLSTTPGAQTWMFKSLASVPTSTLTQTAADAIASKNANSYESIGGASITRQGKTSSGEYIDVIVGADWLEARLTERIYQRLVNLPKVPYTDAGVAIFETEVRAQLMAAIDAGVLAADPKPVVTVPSVRNVSANDRAGRVLPDIRFTAYLSGAIHSVKVEGVVTI